MNAFNLSNQALSYMWQETRDAANWSFQSSQTDAAAQAQLVVAALGNEAITDKSNLDFVGKLGGFALDIWNKK
jgi:hypothetical protein